LITATSDNFSANFAEQIANYSVLLPGRMQISAVRLMSALLASSCCRSQPRMTLNIFHKHAEVGRTAQDWRDAVPEFRYWHQTNRHRRRHFALIDDCSRSVSASEALQ